MRLRRALISVAVWSLAAHAAAQSCEAFASGALEHATAVGDAIALAHLVDPRGPAGYSSDARLHTVEVRELASLAPRWRRVVDGPVYALAGSADGALVAVGTPRSALVLDAADGRELARLDGETLALAFGTSGVLARATRASVTVHAGPTWAQVREHAITGSAPTVVHAMMMDGTCEERHEQAAAHVTALAVGAGDAVYAGASDGSVRALGSSRRFDLPGAQAGRGYATQAILLAPRGRSIVSVWNDGRVVTLDARTLRARRQLRGECSAAERARVSDCQAGALSAAIHGDRVATPGRVRTLGGGALATMATYASSSVFLAGDELWLFGVEGIAERWSLDRGGRFLGYLPIAGRTGWVRDVSSDGRYVALVTPREPRPAAELDRGERYGVRVFDTQSMQELTRMRRPGVRALFLDGGRVAIEGDRSVEVLEVPSGRRLREVPIGADEHAGLVAARGDRVVVMRTPGHAQVVSTSSGASVDVRFGAGIVTDAALEGDTLAILVLDAPRAWGERGEQRLDVISLASGARVQTIDAITDGGVELDGSSVVFVRAGVATRLDLASGSMEPLAPAGVRWVGRARGAGSSSDWIFGVGGGAAVVRGGAPFGPPALRIVRAQRLASVTLLYELGGAVYVVDRAGVTRGSLDAFDGGFLASSVDGHASGSAEALAALASRDGAMLRACAPRAIQPALLHALLAP